MLMNLSILTVFLLFSFKTNSSDPIPGYLSLISCESGKLVLLKWTPNSAVTNQYNLSPLSLTNTINNNSNNTNLYSSTDSLIDSRLDIDSIEDKETYWGYAIKIKMDDIVYAHYHESSDQYIMTLIRNDGIQLAPFHFYAQSHIVTLLNCLEQGFKKSGGYLDPSPNISDTSSACIPSSFNKSYRPSMPFIFANRNSLLPSSTNNKLDSTVSHASSPLLQTSLSPLLKSSKLEQSIPITSSNHITIVSGGGAGGIKQRFYMNFLKAFSHPDEMNNEGIQKTNISQSIDLSAERYPVQHVYHIVSKCNEIRTVVSPRSKTSPIGFGFNKVSALSNKVSLEGISEENMPNLDDITVQLAEDNSSNQHICTKLRIKILSHLFHKWYNYFNKIQIVRKKLSDLVSSNLLTVDSPTNAEEGVTINLWNQLITNSIPKITFSEFCRHIYFGNCDPTIRNQVWPYLLGLYPWDSTDDQVRGINEQQNHIYTNALMTWNRVVDCLQKDVKYANFLSIIPTKSSTDTKISESSEEISTKESNDSEIDDTSKVQSMNGGVTGESKPVNIHPSETNETPVYHIQTPELTESHSRTVSVDSTSNVGETKNPPSEKQCEFSPDTLEAFADNLYRIDKDVSRCDRNHVFFMTPFKGDSKSSPRDHAELNSNLYKLRNIISTWVWLNLDVGYIQGMCDLLAPILIIMEDEVISFACFTCLMKWMLPNFPLVKESSISKSSGSSSSSSPSVMTSSIINDIPTTLTSNDTGMNRKTLLQLAVKAAKRRTTSTHIRESGVDNSYAGKHFPVDTNLRCTSKLKEEATLQESTKRSDAIQQEIIEFTSSVISPYERVLLNSTGLPMSCMDMRFSFLQSLIEIFDPEMNQHLSKKVPDGQLFFAYRWLLLDFKRELKYDDIFPVWETIWASRRLVSYDFGIFFALALLEYYRDIVIYYNMDVTEIIRFYNELTEQHDAITLVELARSYVFQLQHLMKDM
ncbi:unnamed protein product [Heterobilharzia americana]|nr:unnamed protein product [Heterobilharzia americana]